MAEAPLTLVVGAGGLLGSAVRRELARRALPLVTVTVPWADEERAAAVLGDELVRLVRSGRPWRVVWSAGAGVIGTSEQQLRSEVDLLERVLARAEGELGDPSRGGFFLTSSAGGVYAGSSGPPFSEASTPVPISPYGHAKLAAEEVVAQFAARSGLPTAVGRVANLYGPGQDISKPQGLISQLIKAHLFREPLSIYVPLDTARDYIYVDDCARMVLDTLERTVSAGGLHTKLVASEQAVTLGVILAELRRVTKRRPQVVLGASPMARFQVKDLRFRSVVWPDLRRHVTTTLPAGIAATLQSLGQDMRTGALGASLAH